MKKLTALLLCLVLCVSMFVACGDDTPVESSKAPATTGKAPATTGPNTDETDPVTSETDPVTSETIPDDPKEPIAIEDLLPKMPSDEKLAIEDLGAKNPGTVETGHITLGEIGISSLDEIKDPEGKYYLTTDISANETTVFEFSGLLDCCGYTITTSVPLFEILNGVVCNLNLAGELAVGEIAEAPLANEVGTGAIIFNVKNTCNVTVAESTKTDIYAGGFAVKAIGTEILFANCEYAGTIVNEYHVASNNRYSGGFIGVVVPEGADDFATATQIEFINCTFSGSLTATASVGGIVGNINVPVNASFGGCINKGSLLQSYIYHGSGDFSTAAGGLVGSRQGATSSTTEFYNCANDGTVVSYGAYYGGIMGTNRGTSMLDETSFTWCTNLKEVNGHFTGGGMIGYCNGMSFYTECINLGVVRSKLVGEPNLGARYDTYAGGMAGQLGNANASSCDFINCINYANIIICGTNNMAGGLSGRGDVVFYAENCINFGDIISEYKYVETREQGGRIAGMVGSTSTFQGYNCVNFGDIIFGEANARQIISGIVGYCANSNELYPLTLDTCMNYGSLDGRTKVTVSEAHAPIMGSTPAGLAGGHVAGMQPVKFINSISGGAFYTDSNRFVGNIILFAGTGHGEVEGNEITNTYYWADAVKTECAYQAPFIENYNSDGIVLEAFGSQAKTYVESDLQDATSAGLAGKMNAAAGKDIVKCVKVKLDAAEEKTVVVPTAILDLISEFIVK